MGLLSSQDFHDFEKLRPLYTAGLDNLGRQVVVFALYALGEKVDFDRLLLYIIRVMDEVSQRPLPLPSRPSRFMLPLPLFCSASAVGRTRVHAGVLPDAHVHRSTPTIHMAP